MAADNTKTKPATEAAPAEAFPTKTIKVVSEFNLACPRSNRVLTPDVIHEGVPATEWLQCQIDAGLIVEV